MSGSGSCCPAGSAWTAADERLPSLERGAAIGLLASLGLPQLETYTAEQPCRTLSVTPDEYLDAIADSTAFAIANLRALGRGLQAREALSYDASG